MVKLISFLDLSTLIITPTFASELWDLETREVSEPHLFGRELSGAEAAVFAREMEGLFARQQDAEYLDLARRLFNFRNTVLFRRDTDENEDSFRTKANKPHPPPMRHELQERELDDELYIRELIDAELFERFYDDLD